MPTIADVARQAGVSTFTVSRVINGHTVRPENQKKVLDAIRQLNYVPNSHARGLTSGRSQVLGLIVYQIATPFSTRVMAGIERVACEQGYYILLINVGGRTDDQRTETVSRLVKEQRVDGLLVLLPHLGETGYLDRLGGMGSHIVIVDGGADDLTGVDSVRIDDRAGGDMATRYLIELGHRKIGFIGGSTILQVALERKAGYEQALQRTGISYSSDLVYDGDFTYEGGRRGMEVILSQAGRPDAVFAANAVSAIGAMQVLQERGLVVPDDVSVVGYDDDDFDLSVLSHPPLSAVQQPAMRMGEMACHRLIDRINGDEGALNVALQPRLVVRSSTCPARDAGSPGGQKNAM